MKPCVFLQIDASPCESSTTSWSHETRNLSLELCTSRSLRQDMCLRPENATIRRSYTSLKISDLNTSTSRSYKARYVGMGNSLVDNVNNKLIVYILYILKARHVLTPTKSSAPMAAGVVQARHELPARLGAVSHAVSAEEQCFYAPRALAGTATGKDGL